jgi:hypothetical protein
MIRYRTALFAAALAAALAFGGVWYAAGVAPGVHPTPDHLAVPLDDAAIYFQYARQALHGEWLRYNPGAPLSTGVTSALYFLLITLGMGLGLSGPLCAWLLGLAGLLLGLVSADKLSRRLFPDLPPWWAGLLFLSQGALVAAHFNAMETGLQLGLTWALMEALSAEPDPESGDAKPWLWLVMAALAFTRPEGQVLVALLGGAWAWPKARRLAVVLLLALAPTLLLLAVSGSIVPDSVRPKAAALSGSVGLLEHAAGASTYAQGVLKGAWMGFWGGADSVGLTGDAASQNPIGPQFPPLALLGALLGLFHLAQGRRRLFALSIGASMAALLTLLAWNLPVGWHDHRYLSCATPLLLLGMLAGAQALRQGGGRLGKAAAGALFTLWVAFGLATWPWHLKRCYDGAFNYAITNTNAALALRSLPPGPVAVVDSGLLAYYSGREIADLPGITDHALALAYPQGPGATLDTLLRRPHPPLFAALHDQRNDFPLSPWLRSGLLLRVADLSRGMGLYRWDWSGAELRGTPAALPRGHRVLGGLSVADLEDEKTQGVEYQGVDAGHTLLTRLRLWKNGGPLVPEGGRKLAGLTLRAWPAGTRFLLLRAAFAQDGFIQAQSNGPGAVVPVHASHSEVYSEVLVPMGADGSAGETLLSFASTGPGRAPVPGDFALYRVWFLN